MTNKSNENKQTYSLNKRQVNSLVSQDENGLFLQSFFNITVDTIHNYLDIIFVY
jgi:hypothetical protein